MIDEDQEREKVEDDMKSGEIGDEGRKETRKRKRKRKWKLGEEEDEERAEEECWEEKGGKPKGTS